MLEYDFNHIFLYLLRDEIHSLIKNRDNKEKNDHNLLKLMKVNEAYNQWAAQYDSNQNKTRDLDQKVTAEVLNKYAFKSVLELGCGTGKNTDWLRTKAQHILGLDFSEEMLAIAHKKLIEFDDRISFQQADLNESWNVPNEFADLITSSLTLEHIKDLTHIFEQAQQKLKEGGLFFICELHPFKQYAGSKAKFEADGVTTELEVYTHHISEYLNAATQSKLELVELNEWFDEDQSVPNLLPRLVSFVFKKV